MIDQPIDWQNLWNQLSPDERKDWYEYGQSILEKKAKTEPRKPTFDWEGELEDLREEYTSVELQHKTLDWWDEDVAG